MKQRLLMNAVVKKTWRQIRGVENRGLVLNDTFVYLSFD